MIDERNELLGDNTDGAGLLTDLTVNLGIDLIARRILILGAGGATRGVLAPLLEARPTHVVVANRTPARAMELAEEFADLGPIHGCGFDSLAAEPFDLIVNATSASLHGEVPLVPARIIAKHTVCYDMAYGKAIPASRAGRASTVRAAPTRAGECWSSRRLNRSTCGAACAPTPVRSSKRSPRRSES